VNGPVDTVLRAGEIALKILPAPVKWIKSRLDGGYDAEAELDVMLAAGDATIDEYQRQKFGS